MLLVLHACIWLGLELNSTQTEPTMPSIYRAERERDSKAPRIGKQRDSWPHPLFLISCGMWKRWRPSCCFNKQSSAFRLRLWPPEPMSLKWGRKLWNPIPLSSGWSLLVTPNNSLFTVKLEEYHHAVWTVLARVLVRYYEDWQKVAFENFGFDHYTFQHYFTVPSQTMATTVFVK